ncbi:MAG: hypothetical protein ACREJM_02525 [Candidatus Saccharimonadales bacterium]
MSRFDTEFDARYYKLAVTVFKERPTSLSERVDHDPSLFQYDYDQSFAATLVNSKRPGERIEVVLLRDGRRMMLSFAAQ